MNLPPQPDPKTDSDRSAQNSSEESAQLAPTGSSALEFPRTPAASAFFAAEQLPASWWPRGDALSRLEPICLPDVQPGFRLTAGEAVFTIGSCFARHIELALQKRGYRTPAMNFAVPKNELWRGTQMTAGILNKYSPFSMLNELRFAFDNSSGEQYLIKTPSGSWDGQLHTNVSVPFSRALERRTELRNLYRSAILDCPTVVITLGLAESWYDTEHDHYLNETLLPRLAEQYPNRFRFEVLSPETVIATVCTLIDELHQANPLQRALLSVSPVPLQRSFSGQDAITANSYSKSVLRVAAEVARRRFPHVDYYPSFESITHSDRQQTWEDARIHVRQVLVAANVDRMIQLYTDST